MRALSELDGELIVVDNASPDNSLEQLNAWRASLDTEIPVRIIASPDNGGYAAGNNLGLKNCDAPYCVLLNSDTLVEPNAFKTMLSVMEQDPRLGILGPQITDETGNRLISRFRRPSPLGEFVAATDANVFFKMFSNRVVPIFDNESDDEVEWIGFPCVMLRREMIDEIGLLDEKYFMYFEDVAYCDRATKADWRIAHCNEARVQHFCGQSSQIEKDTAEFNRLPRYYYASRSRYFVSTYGPVGYFAANLLWYFGRCFAYLRVLALKPPKKTSKGRAVDIWIRDTGQWV